MVAFELKCYLLSNEALPKSTSNPEVKEIRRFNFTDENRSGIYQNLRKDIFKRFSDVINSENELVIYWMDEENEFITISSDEELNNCLEVKNKKFESSKIIRLYVTKSINQPKQSDNCFFGSRSSGAEEFNEQDFMKFINKLGDHEEIRNLEQTFRPMFDMFINNFQPMNGCRTSCYQENQKTDEQKIKETIEKLKSMGYSDQNGFFSEILHQNGCNINELLDILCH